LRALRSGAESQVMTKDEDVPKADVRKPAGNFIQRMDRKWLLFWIVSIVSLVLDQITKIWARASLPVHPDGCVVPDDIIVRKCIGTPVTVIQGYWDWRLSMNPGSAFGLFGGLGPSFTRVFLSLIGVAAVIGMVYMLKKSRPDQRILHWALALVAGGAVGNLIDRIYYSVVTDFILWKYKTHEWPVFNIADVVLVVGVGLMFIDIQKENKREKVARKDRQAKAKQAGLVKDNL
jgi:lipoprotein signal peptidase